MGVVFEAIRTLLTASDMSLNILWLDTHFAKPHNIHGFLAQSGLFNGHASPRVGDRRLSAQVRFRFCSI